MESKRKHPKQFDSVCHDMDLPVDNHEKAAAEQQLQRACRIGPRVDQMSTVACHPVLRSASDSYLVTARDTRMLTAGQPGSLATTEIRPGNGEDPAPLQLSCPEVAHDSEIPPDVRDSPKNDPPFQRMKYHDISAGRQTTFLTDCLPLSSETKAASVGRPGARRTAQTEEKEGTRSENKKPDTRHDRKGYWKQLSNC